LAFQGEHDDFGSIEQLNILKKEIPSFVTIAEITSSGHTPRKESENETMKLIKSFFRNNLVNF